MSAPLSVIAAQTHPPRYGLHKYWSRKPHNVVRHVLLRALPEGPGVVVDPFVGSGVTAREAADLGHEVFAGDINPLALLLTQTTCAPPDPDRFQTIMQAALAALQAQIADDWTCPTSRRLVRHALHAVVTRCASCDLAVAAHEARAKGRARRCPACAQPLRFNFEHRLDTRIIGADLADDAEQPGLRRDAAHVEEVAALVEQYDPRRAGVGRAAGISDDPALLDHQERASRRWRAPGQRVGPLFEPMPVNRRILALPEMTPADLFTPRALSALLIFRDIIAALDDPAIRRCGMLMLTASAAQCSRLVASRNNLTSGGPAWSVPGFWVPPLHLETNPALHLQARLERFARGLRDLKALGPPAGRVHVEESDAPDLLRALPRRGVAADLVFLDPPYGDSVPFVEFSAFWNGLLDRAVDADADLSVSDRLAPELAWARYAAGLRQTLDAAAAALSPSGRVLITFNNHDARAWRALLDATQAAGLKCVEVAYPIPAVISSKAAFHPEGSYLGDVWALMAPAATPPSLDESPALAALQRCAEPRGGLIARNLALRTLALCWLSDDIDAALIDRWPALLDHLFEAHGPHLLRWRGAPSTDAISLKARLLSIAADTLARGPCRWRDLYAATAAGCADCGVPDSAEVRALIGPALITSGTKITALRDLDDPPR